MKRGRSYISIAFVMLAAAGAAGAQWHVVKTGMDFQTIDFGDSMHGTSVVTLVDTFGYNPLYNHCYFTTNDGGKNWTLERDYRGDIYHDAMYQMKQRDSIVYILNWRLSYDGMHSESYSECSWNYGSSWTAVSFEHNGAWYYRNGIDIDRRGHIWRTDNVAWRRDGPTSSWDSVGTILPMKPGATKLWLIDTLTAFHLVNGTNNNFFFHTSDGCISWSLIDSNNILGTLDVPSVSRLWALSGNDVYSSSDSGHTWHVQHTASSPVRCVTHLDTLRLWVGCDQGFVLKTIDGGINWESKQLSTNARVLSVSFVSDTCGWAVTSDSTLWGYGIAGTGVSGGPATTSISVNPDVRIYPNPGEGKRRIEFTLEKQGQVDVSIYDISGRCIKAIAGGSCQAGRHSIQWDGRDANGAPVASGVYLCRVTSPSIELKVKALVIKGR
ncbi:MAG TPA: hypothetical protein DDW31_05515 [candidate division Zixibacteria bacterium]|nr:hypothetical protein [candidate division Zixibacteria bacterium]